MTSILDATVTSSIDLPHDEELPTCVRCKLDITTGHAYELGDDKWHTHCFSCYRCNKPLSCESDFLVLGTGTLICFDCSDSCKSCGKKIDDLAIILPSSNEAYCSGCFKCCKCGNKIKDLRYAKTKRGLFCLSCHERLLAKRKYYEEKKRRLTKHLPTIPKELQGEAQQQQKQVDIPSSPRELKIPERSRNRPLSPGRKGSNASNLNTHKRNVSMDDMLKATVAEKIKDTISPGNKSNIDDSSLDNLSLEPLENLENEGIIDSIAPQNLVTASPLLVDHELPARTNSNNTSNSYKGGLLAEALNDPRSPTAENFGGLGISSASLSPGSIPDLGIRSIDGPLKIDNAKSPSSIILDANAQPTMKTAADIEPVQMYKTPALDFSNSSTSIRRDFLNTDMDVYNDEETERKIGASTQELHDLEKDVQMLREIKKKLLHEITIIEERKTKLLQEVHELDYNRSNSVPIRTDSPHIKHNRIRPPPEVPFIKLAESPSPSKEQEHVASVARQAKPKFWKLFSSSSPPKPSMMAKSSPSKNVSNMGTNKTGGKELLSGQVDKLKPFANKIQQSGSSQSISSSIKIPGSNLYGSTLVQRCEYEQLHIPKVLTSCMENIECDEENLKSEGLYRKSGSQAVIEQLEKQFAEGKEVNLADYDINVSTGILKRYLRKLSDPVVTFQIYEPLMEIVRKYNMVTKFPIGKTGVLAPQDIAPVIDVINMLPKEHIYLLKVLSIHLERVMKYKDYNLMGLNNISLVFAPGLIRDVSGEKDISDMRERNYIIAFILEHYKELFD